MTRDRRGSLGTAKGSRNLLLNFHHPQISFCLVGAYRHRQIVQESKDLLGSRKKGIQEIFGVVLFAATRFLGDASDGREEPGSDEQQSPVGGSQNTGGAEHRVPLEEADPPPPRENGR